MKRYILFFAFSVFALVSCTKDEGASAPEEKSGISLEVVCSKMSPVTKAGISGTKPGEDAYDENIIKTIDYYFYPEGATDQNSVLHARVSPNALNQYTTNVAIDEAMLNTILFPRPTNTCQVAVLVNYPGAHPAENTKLADLEALNLTLQLTEGTKPRGKDQTEFVMFGVQQVTLISRKATLIANPTVDVHRVACKITLDAHVVDKTVAPVQLIDGDTTYTLNQEWKPMLNQMYVYLENGVSNAIVSGNPEATKPYNYFKYDQREFTGEMATHTITRKTFSDDDPPVETGTVTTTEQFHKSHPFYTYPQTWATSDPKEPFLKLVLPWTRLAGDDHETNQDWETKPHTWGSIQKQFYYRILLPNNATGFVSNNWYHINLDVAILGSDIDDASVDIEGTYWVVPWSEGPNVEADIKGSRYLSVSQTYHYMYNTTELKIPYVTSNPCSIQGVVVTQYDFENRTTKTYSGSAVAGWVTLDDNNNIVINHGLNNDFITTNDFDVAPYIFTFRIRHSDSEGNTYYKDITVEQYPAMYIEEAESNGYVFVKETGNRTSSSRLWDDNGTQTLTVSTADGSIGQTTGYSSITGSGSNNNKYQYTVHVTVLPDDYASSLGDPRVPTGISGEDSDELVYKLTGLTNYKPAADNTEDIIAPVFKVASSYGKTGNTMTYKGAVKRCASYQENGYPAGRWRLPTKAEIEFLMTLSIKEKIPSLFNSSQNTRAYWAAGGYVFAPYIEQFFKLSKNTAGEYEGPTGISNANPYYTLGGVNYNVSTRCVYDVWYWGDTQDSAHLTSWGGYQTTDPS